MNNLLSGAPLYYPSAREWMWDYCIYLGPFTDSDNKNWDLGIWLGSTTCAAGVYGDVPGNYMSGELKYGVLPGGGRTDVYLEIEKRAKLLNLLPE